MDENINRDIGAVQEQIVNSNPSPQQPGRLPYLQEQTNNLADTIVVKSLDTIPEEIFLFFWHGFGIDLLVNKFTERDIAVLEMQVFRTILNRLSYIPIPKLRQPVELTIPRIKQQLKNIKYENGEEGYETTGETKEYIKYKLENVYWDELIDRVIMRIMLMAKRSRDGFTMDKLTSFKSTQGYQVEAMTKEPKGRWA